MPARNTATWLIKYARRSSWVRTPKGVLPKEEGYDYDDVDNVLEGDEYEYADKINDDDYDDDDDDGPVSPQTSPQFWSHTWFHRKWSIHIRLS